MLQNRGAMYYYITNLQGDVIRLVNSSGQTAAYYEYDPYGNAIQASGSHATINPLRYRGYYYDTETGLYYLQSRYYDPAVGRFVNADVYASTGDGFLGFNMFAYCGNVPVLCRDSEGSRPINALSVSAETEEERRQSFEYMNGNRNTQSNSFDWTASIGASGSGSMGPWAGNVQGFITLDSRGNVALQVAWSGGISTHVADSGFSAALTPFVMITNAPSYEGLEGRGASIGGTIPANYTIIVDYNMMLDKSGQKVLYHGITVGAGLGAGTPEVHAMWGGETYTIGAMPALEYIDTVNYLSTLW